MPLKILLPPYLSQANIYIATVLIANLNLVFRIIQSITTSFGNTLEVPKIMISYLKLGKHFEDTCLQLYF